MKASIVSETERFLVVIILLSFMHHSASGRYLFRPVGLHANSYYQKLQDYPMSSSSEVSLKRSEPYSSIVDPNSGQPQRNSAEDNFLGKTRKYTWFKKNSAKQQQFLPDLEGKRHLAGGPRKEILFRQCYFNPISCF